MGAGGSGRGNEGQLAQVARRRAQAQATSKKLNINTERGGPQAPVRQNQPPGQIPAAEPDAQGASPQEKMLAATKQFLQKAKRPGAEPVDQPQARVTVPAKDDGMITDKARRLGIGGLSADQQFYRLSGRRPTPRDLAVFRTVQLLEGQLGRKPTSTELRVALSRPTLLGISAPAAVEV